MGEGQIWSGQTISNTQKNNYFSDFIWIYNKNGNIFDETYVNSSEDIDLSREITKDHNKISIIEYRVGDYIGKNLGK